MDAYFVAFERIAGKLNWPKDMWALFLQCSLVGKAQEVSSALSLEDSLDYDVVKSTVLRAYELVPEAIGRGFVLMRRHPNKRMLNLGERKELCLRSGVCLVKLTLLNNFVN